LSRGELAVLIFFFLRSSCFEEARLQQLGHAGPGRIFHMVCCARSMASGNLSLLDMPVVHRCAVASPVARVRFAPGTVFFCPASSASLRKNFIFGNSSVAPLGRRFRFLELLLGDEIAYLLLEILFPSAAVLVSSLASRILRLIPSARTLPILSEGSLLPFLTASHFAIELGAGSRRALLKANGAFVVTFSPSTQHRRIGHADPADMILPSASMIFLAWQIPVGLEQLLRTSPSCRLLLQIFRCGGAISCR